MATYNLTAAELNSVLGTYAPDAQGAIVKALYAGGTYPSATNPADTITAELVNNSGPTTNFYDLSAGQELFIEFGAGGDSSTYMSDVVVTHEDTVIALAGASYTQLFVTGDSSSTVLAGDGDFLTISGNGDDVIFGGDGEFQILQGFGEDTLIGGGENYLVAYGTGNTLYGGLSGTASDTLIASSGGGNLLKTFVGDNMLLGVTGSDTLLGGAGDDTLTAGLSTTAHDTLIAGAGNNLLQVVEGNNGLYSAGGMDTLLGGAGDDTLYGGGQSWLIAGTGGSNLIGVGSDTLVSGSGDDFLTMGMGSGTFFTGTGGNDTVFGGSSDDLFYNGLAGNDTIYGGGGDDTINFYAYTEAEVSVTVNADGSTLYSFGSGEDAKTALVYNVQNVTFKQPS